MVGVSRLHRAAGVIGAAQALNEFTGSMWRNGVNPSRHDPGRRQARAPTARSSCSERLRRLFSRHRAMPRALMLDQGAEWQPLSVSPEDAELLASRRFTAEETARVFGVPPPLVRIWDHTSFTNSEQAAAGSRAHTLAHGSARSSSKPSARCSAPRPRSTMSSARHGDLLRGSPLERWQANKLAVESGVLDPDEVRQ